ncbi:hypothetical protein [Mesorhizobium sp. Pch-S]|uniref:hypothetical protein n=1 Tax=Mesorhizobium sp. Pch-S TaxID=2082387 RepID=UPI001FE05BB6|nr:hypothetical protein [Mesorhizobium sp. Pch-S]
MNIQLREKPDRADGILAVSKHFLASDDGTFEVRYDGSRLTLACPTGVRVAQAALIRHQGELLLDDVVFEAGRQDQPQMLAALADAVFTRFPDAGQILLPPVEETWPVIGWRRRVRRSLWRASRARCSSVPCCGSCLCSGASRRRT